MSAMEKVSYRVANDKYDKNSYYVDTGFMYIEQDLITGQVRDVTDSFANGQKAINHEGQRPLPITNGSARPGSVILSRPGLEEEETIVRNSVIIPPKKEGSVIIQRNEGSVIASKREGSVIMPKKSGSIILPQKEMSIVNGSVVRRPERVIQRIVTPRERIVETPRERIITKPRERIIESPRQRIMVAPNDGYVVRDRPQTVRVIRSGTSSIRRIPEEPIHYVTDDMPQRYVTRRVLVRNGVDEDYDNVQRLYKTTINVASSESDSSDGPKEVVKTRYISSPSNRFKNVKGIPAAKMYVPKSGHKPSKNSNSDDDSSSLDSVDIKKFEKELLKGKRSEKK